LLKTYSVATRLIHWISAVLIVALLVLGFWMTERSSANLWDALTNTLYSWHKLIGFTVLLITLLRIGEKLSSQKPPYPSSVPQSQIQIAKSVQGALYLLLLLTPLLGWAGVTAFPALITVGGYHLPAMPGIPKDQALAKQLFEIHGYLALALLAVAAVHIAAGLQHLLLKKDGVFERMWFKR
jgi:cytochrome b561